MFLRVLILTIIVLPLLGGAASVSAQTDDFPDASGRTGRSRREDSPHGLREMLAKQRTERDKKEHQELLERGDSALRLTKQLEAAYAQNGGFSADDRARLEELERTVAKIRKELGAEDDEVPARDPVAPAVEEPRPSNMGEAFGYLKSTTVKLVDELKKSTRFSVSVVAIQTSNTVLKLVKFLRLKK